jgi:hypothetical protein
LGRGPNAGGCGANALSHATFASHVDEFHALGNYQGEI